MAEPPIKNLDVIDVLGRRQDGGIDLAIVVSGPLLNTTDHLDRVERKIKSYIDEILSIEFAEQFPTCDASRQILLVTNHDMDPAVLALIDSLRGTAMSAGTILEVVTPGYFSKD